MGQTASDHLDTQCVIAGGGPAGLMLGYLLARAGVQVTVLEKHADFLRDFRGDTVHPSTLAVMRALGDLDGFLTRPHDKTHSMSMCFGARELKVVDFTTLDPEIGYVAMMPQWEFLDFLAQRAQSLPGFKLMMSAKATELVDHDGHIRGLRGEQNGRHFEIRADLVVGADGRHSVLRAQSGLPSQELGAPIDVLWFRLPREAGAQSLGRISAHGVFIMLNRGAYWQVARVVPKDGYDAIRADGLEAFRTQVAQGTSLGDAAAGAIASWDDVKLLRVQIDRLSEWSRPGLVFIGDAAHAMSPVGGIGINLAIQDAVAAANLLAKPLLGGHVKPSDLAKLQARRDWPTRATQRAQVMMHNRLLVPLLNSATPRPPLPLHMLSRFSWLRRFPARFVGMGLRPELPDAHLFPPTERRHQT